LKVIDVGVGLERVPWLINGSPTSYFDVFGTAFEYLTKKIDIPLYNEVWEKVGPFTCRLNID
jgi:alanyl-tRNA synthetase